MKGAQQAGEEVGRVQMDGIGDPVYVSSCQLRFLISTRSTATQFLEVLSLKMERVVKPAILVSHS